MLVCTIELSRLGCKDLLNVISVCACTYLLYGEVLNGHAKQIVIGAA